MMQLDIFTQGRPSAIPPRDRVQAGCYWIRENRTNFKRIMLICHREVDKGNPCLQRGHVYKLAQDAGMSVTVAQELKRDHNLWSVITRYMVMLRPRLARSINFRTAPVDTVDFAKEWREIVDPQTEFLARDWREAKRLCEMRDVTSL